MRRAAILTLLCVAAAVPARAQSLYSTRGLGAPVAPVDARARALGGIQTGLIGFSLGMGNPADAAGIVYRGALATIQPSTRNMELDGQSSTVSGTRFPLVRALFPFRNRFVASLGFGSYLDQTWGVIRSSTEVLGDESVNVQDMVRSTGGISQVRLGVSYSLSPSFAVGVAGGAYVGGLDREVTRSFPDSANANLAGFTSRVSWGERAPLVSVGARWDPASIVRVGAGVTWGGTLHARGDTVTALDRSFSLPTEVTAGASAILAPRLLLAVGGSWAGWSRAANDFRTEAFGDPGVPAANITARNTFDVGGGLEYTGLRTESRVYPLRLGYHRSQYPFFAQGEAPANEWSASGGIGYRIAGQEASPVVAADLAVERGGRSGGPLTESFWRLTASIALFGR
ncbi:MAG TPA: hypothetical protein VFQ38_13830 [Longimicrobiales bacterium]|nr:hypothetical protein [Longimicrobiales bacterium]